MKFKLRTLLIFVTISAFVMAIWLQRMNYQRKLESHRSSFQQLAGQVQQLDQQIEHFILQIPSIQEQLEQTDPINPHMTLGRSITGTSWSIGEAHFSRQYHFSWQKPDGSRVDGIRLAIESSIDESTFDPHLVIIRHAADIDSRKVVMMVDANLKLQTDARTKLVEDSQISKKGVGSF